MITHERIFLQGGDNCPDDADSKELDEVMHSSERIFRNDVEYVRKDIVEEMAKDAMKFILDRRIGCLFLSNDMSLTDSFDRVFAEFINSRKA